MINEAVQKFKICQGEEGEDARLPGEGKIKDVSSKITCWEMIMLERVKAMVVLLMNKVADGDTKRGARS